jgi:hypothetical protein
VSYDYTANLRCTLTSHGILGTPAAQ